MEFRDAVHARRMTRAYDPDRPVPAGTLTGLLDLAVRAPSAGFSQGWDFLVLTDAADRERFWRAGAEDTGPPDSWLLGMRTAPALVVCMSDPQRYLDRYAEPDKGWTDRDPGRWPVPYWDVDVGMASMILLLAAVDAGLTGCFFGVPPAQQQAVLAAFGAPADRRIVGVVSLGYPVPHPRSPSLRRGRRPLAEVVHAGRFGRPWPPGPVPAPVPPLPESDRRPGPA